MAKRISPAKRAALTPVVLAHIQEACRVAGPTPTYMEMVKACRDVGVTASESEMSAVLEPIIADGSVRKVGSFYATSEGATTSRQSAARHDLPSRGIRLPTLEERAAWYGAPLAESHPSSRTVMPDRSYPARAWTSGAGRWGSPLS
jgi:hypothetical protein